MNELLYGDNSARQAVATGANPNFHPDDDQLIREFINGIEACTLPNTLDFRFPRSAVEAVIRRLRSAF